MESNVNQKIGLLQLLEQTPASEIANLKAVSDKFKRLFCIVHLNGKMDRSGIRVAESFYEAEKLHFMKLINDNKELQDCTKLSLYGCWMDVAINRLSFDPSFKHLYLVPYSHNVAKKGQPDRWEKRASLEISGYGELLLRQMQGQIRYADNPVLVYHGDKFQYGTRNGSSFVDHESVLPRREGAKIIACYLKITRTDDTVDYKVITQEDVDRFIAYATKKNKGKLPDSWAMGEGGMWQSKCIKHAFKNYPKIRMGEFSKLLTQKVEDDEVETGFNYEIEDIPAEVTPAPETAPEAQQASTTPAPPPPDDDWAKSEPRAEKTVKKDNDAF